MNLTNITVEEVQAILDIQRHVKSGPIKDGYSESSGFACRAPAPPFICKDGFHMSLQASASHYCTPQNNIGPYTEFEAHMCGSPPEFEGHGGYDDPDWGKDVYSYIPLEKVVQCVLNHGGYDERASVIGVLS